MKSSVSGLTAAAVVLAASLSISLNGPHRAYAAPGLPASQSDGDLAVTVLSPTPRTSFSGTKPVEISAFYQGTASNQIVSLELYVDGANAFTKKLDSPETKGVISFLVDASQLSAGPHKIVVRAVAVDAEVVSAKSSFIYVADNQAETALTPSTSNGSGAPVEMSFLSPSPDQKVEGTVHIELTPTANSIQSPYVSVFVDRQFKTMRNYAPYTYDLDTTGYSNGYHTIEVYAYDDSQRVGPAKVMRIYVNNPGGETSIRTDLQDGAPIRGARAVPSSRKNTAVAGSRVGKPFKTGSVSRGQGADIVNSALSDLPVAKPAAHKAVAARPIDRKFGKSVIAPRGEKSAPASAKAIGPFRRPTPRMAMLERKHELSELRAILTAKRPDLLDQTSGLDLSSQLSDPFIPDTATPRPSAQTPVTGFKPLPRREAAIAKPLQPGALTAHVMATPEAPKTAHVEAQLPIAAAAPVKAQLPIAKPAPVKAQLPIAKPAPVKAQLPIAKPAPVKAQLPVAKPAPIKAQLPVAKPAPIKAQTPVAKPKPVQAQLPAAKPETVKAQLPAAKPVHVEAQVKLAAPAHIQAQHPAAKPATIAAHAAAKIHTPVGAPMMVFTPAPQHTGSAAAPATIDVHTPSVAGGMVDTLLSAPSIPAAALLPAQVNVAHPAAAPRPMQIVHAATAPRHIEAAHPATAPQHIEAARPAAAPRRVEAAHPAAAPKPLQIAHPTAAPKPMQIAHPVTQKPMKMVRVTQPLHVQSVKHISAKPIRVSTPHPLSLHAQTAVSTPMRIIGSHRVQIHMGAPSLLRARGKTSVFFNTVHLKMDRPFVVHHGVMFVPLRQLAEFQGANLTWDEKTGTVHAISEAKEITLQIGKRHAAVNKSAVKLDQAPFLLNGRTMVPVSFMTQALDVNMSCDPVTGHVILTSKA